MSFTKSRLAFCFLLGMLLYSCVAPRQSVSVKATSDASSPNANSIYYYLVGTMFEEQGNSDAASMLLQKALDNDPQSTQIKRRLLQNSFQLYAQGLIQPAELKNQIEQYSAQADLDEELLIASYDFYDEVADSTALANTMQELVERHPSARTYIQRFLYEFRQHGKPHQEYLDSALQLSRNDPRTLFYLAEVYLYFDADKAQSVLMQLNEVAPSEESHSLLARILLDRQDTPALGAYFATLQYPRDREYMRSLLSLALDARLYDMVLALDTAIIGTNDLDLMYMLGFAALIRNYGDVIHALETALLGSTASAEEKLALRSLLAAYTFKAGEEYALDASLGLLSSSQAYEDILTFYSFAVAAALSPDATQIPQDAYSSFAQSVQRRLRDEAPARFLSAMATSAYDSTYTGFADAKLELILYLKERGVLPTRDYEFLLQYYTIEEMPDTRRNMLEEAARHYPDYPLFANDLGYTLLVGGGDPEEAARLIQKALYAEPDNPYYLDSMAWYHYLKGDFSSAAELIQIPRSMESMPAEIAWHIGAIYLKLGKYDSAREYLEKCIAIGNDPQSVSLAEQALRQIP